VPLGIVTLLGQGFTQQSQVLVDGQPASLTIFDSPSMIHAQIDISFNGGWPGLSIAITRRGAPLLAFFARGG
jgi:hypothetical protein